jgi:amino acid transporter
LTSTRHFRPLAGEQGTLSLFFAALVPVMFTYGGWQNLSFVAGEVKDPVRVLPRAILTGVGIVILVYVGICLAYLHVLGAEGLATTTTPAAAVAAAIAGPIGDRVVSALVVVSAFGFLNLGLMTAPRVYYAMAADGLFFKGVSRLHPRTHAPVMAILVQVGLSSVFAVLNTYPELVAYAVFADWIFFSLTGIALIIFRRRLRDVPRPWPVPLYPYTVWLFVAAGLGIVINLFITDPHNALMGSVILALGVPSISSGAAAGRDLLSSAPYPIHMSHDLLKGKRGLITGALNEQSIAWKVAQEAHAEGAHSCSPTRRSPCAWVRSTSWRKPPEPRSSRPTRPMMRTWRSCSPKASSNWEGSSTLPCTASA